MVNACADPDFLSERRERGGVGSKPNGEKTALIFFYVCFGVFWSKIFRGGGSNYLRGGVQMLISIEFDRTCDLPGMGVRTPYPPPLPLDLHMHDIVLAYVLIIKNIFMVYLIVIIILL